MDIDALVTFIAVADSGSFSKAAERLFVTQPAVSKRIAALESELDTHLFDRIGKQVILTEAGNALLSNAHNIVQAVKESRRVITNLSDQISGPLGLGISHHIGLHRLPPVLKRYTHNYPDVQLDIRFLDSEEGCLAVEQGSLELAVITLPNAPSPQLHMQSIWHDPLSIVVAKDHPLIQLSNKKLKKNQQPIFSKHAMLQYPAVLPATGTFTRKIIEQSFADMQPGLNVIMETNYLETIKMMVSIGLGWSVLPSNMLKDDDIQAAQIEGLQLDRELGVVQHKERTLTNAAKTFLKILTEESNKNT